MWNEVMLWLTQMMGYNEYIPLLKRQMNDAKENWLYSTIFDVPDSFSAKYSMHEMDKHPDKHPYKAQCSKRKNHLNYLQVAFRITSLFVLTNFEVKYLSQHIGNQNKYCRGKSSRLEYYSKWLKYYFLIKNCQITPIELWLNKSLCVLKWV